MEKRISVLASVLLVLTLALSCASGETAVEENFGIFPAVAGDAGTTYVNLFDVILDAKYDEYWTARMAEHVGEENAEAMTIMLKGFISSDIYGQEAVDAYANADGYGFDCYYINDVASFTFQGDQVTTVYTDGTESTHTYVYLGQYMVGEGEVMLYQGNPIDPAFPCDVYQSMDDAGESTYFFLRDDTMAETYHIEFRYGSDLEQLQKYLEGDYAYWLAAGIDADADEGTIHNVIDLFIGENF